MSNVSLVVLSSDGYSKYWDWFFTLKKKYWADCPYDTYLVTESKKTRKAKTINIDSDIWTKRFREALKEIPSDYVIVLLEDYFIRSKVDQTRIAEIFEFFSHNINIAVFNFEENYRPADESIYNLPGWKQQKNKQIYLNSTQPSIWNKELLLSRLKEDQNPWEWELTRVESPYDHLINTSTQIIDNGYRFGQPFGIVKGEMCEECEAFLRTEGLL